MTDDSTTGTQKVAELVDQARICMLTTMTTDGKHVSRPMALQDVEFDGDLWFFAYDDSAKAAEVRANPQVNVGFADDEHQAWVSISGAATLAHCQILLDHGVEVVNCTEGGVLKSNADIPAFRERPIFPTHARLAEVVKEMMGETK